MYKSFLEDYIVKETETIVNAYWKYSRHKKILMVVDENDNFKGIITSREIEDKAKTYNTNEPTGTITNTKCKAVQFNENREIMYGFIRNIFIDNPNIHYLPILEGNNIIDLFSRQRALWLPNLEQENLPYINYAKGLYESAKLAKNLGYKKMSAVEFGVAGGNGLRILEVHALEVSRLLNIEIEVYGFDLGKGLPNLEPDYRNMVHFWQSGCYQMDEEKLRKSLRFAKLIMGNLENTLPDFINEYNPAPIGFISIDVDFYSSAKPVMNFLEHINEEFCIPRISIYFDDVYEKYEFQGENLAIQEFHQNCSTRRVSPIESSVRLKTLHIFDHKLYNKNCEQKFELPHMSHYYI